MLSVGAASLPMVGQLDERRYARYEKVVRWEQRHRENFLADLAYASTTAVDSEFSRECLWPLEYIGTGAVWSSTMLAHIQPRIY